MSTHLFRYGMLFDRRKLRRVLADADTVMDRLCSDAVADMDRQLSYNPWCVDGVWTTRLMRHA